MSDSMVKKPSVIHVDINVDVKPLDMAIEKTSDNPPQPLPRKAEA